ncbi:MAG: GNAT family N-acetyltransferase [Clostridia bacterium]|nr:GNAT family N-acetyltransferase [Clostridia bacterium]
MTDLVVRPLRSEELTRLTALFHYNDVPSMIADNARRIDAGTDSIYLLLENGDLVGELHITWSSEDTQAVISGQRAYLYAFRIRADRQGRGYGQHLLQSVINAAAARGVRELTIGVEEDNLPARHIYDKFGFTELLARRSECYQGDSYQYGLFLRRHHDNCPLTGRSDQAL